MVSLREKAIKAAKEHEERIKRASKKQLRSLLRK